MKQIKSLHIDANQPRDKEVIRIINRFASLQNLLPTAALKRFILQTMPTEINKLEKQSQYKSGAKR